MEYEIKYGSKVYTTRNLRYNVTGLATFASHNVTVLSVNNVTRAIGISKGKTISFKTSSGREYIFLNFSAMSGRFPQDIELILKKYL